MLGFDLDIWDYLTFLVLMVAGLGVLVALVWLAGLPGRIAIARNHPEAEAVRLMGYAGFFTVVVWLKAFLWAFKPTRKSCWAAIISFWSPVGRSPMGPRSYIAPKA